MLPKKKKKILVVHHHFLREWKVFLHKPQSVSISYPFKQPQASRVLAQWTRIRSKSGLGLLFEYARKSQIGSQGEPRTGNLSGKLEM